MNSRKILFFVLVLLFVGFVEKAPLVVADKGYPGLESSDPERYYHRLKSLRMKRPNDPEHTFRVANLLYSWKMEDEAIYEYRRCLKIDPNHLNAKWFLSHLLFSKGYYDEAFRHARDIMDKKPDDPEIYYWTGEILLKLDQSQAASEYFARYDELKNPPAEKPAP